MLLNWFLNCFVGGVVKRGGKITPKCCDYLLMKHSPLYFTFIFCYWIFDSKFFLTNRYLNIQYLCAPTPAFYAWRPLWSNIFSIVIAVGTKYSLRKSSIWESVEVFNLLIKETDAEYIFLRDSPQKWMATLKIG